MRELKPIIGVTLGDPKGIGPEIVAKALVDPRVRGQYEVRVFGDDAILATAQEMCRRRKEQPEKLPATSHQPPVTLSDVDAGRWSAQWVADAVKAVLAGTVDAIVTAPIHKARWEAGGIHFPGHTEYLAHLAGQTASSIGPLFLSPRWRVALATGHISLKNVPRILTRERIVATALLVNDYLQSMFGIATPRLACLGLNPHAGEAGLLGLEEDDIIAQAMSLLHDRGVHIEGPFPADTFFVRSSRFEVRGSNIEHRTPNIEPPYYDAVLAMYHDQGLLPLKTMYFQETVQVTMGLPFIRTSVDHGTADDIAWQGIADHTNLVAAIELAVQLIKGTSKNRPSALLPAHSPSSRTPTVRSGGSYAGRLASGRFLEVPQKWDC